MRLHHIAVEVNNLERSISFYQEVLAFKLKDRIRLMGEELAFLTLENITLELLKSVSPSLMTEKLHFAFEVDDLSMLIEGLKHQRVKILEGPYLLENGWKNLFIQGPDGECIEFIENIV